MDQQWACEEEEANTARAEHHHCVGVCATTLSECVDHWSSPAYHILCKCRFLLSTERTSLVKRRASRTGSRFSRAVSLGSQNQDLIGIALSTREEEGVIKRYKLASVSQIVQTATG